MPCGRTVPNTRVQADIGDRSCGLNGQIPQNISTSFSTANERERTWKPTQFVWMDIATRQVKAKHCRQNNILSDPICQVSPVECGLPPPGHPVTDKEGDKSTTPRAYQVTHTYRSILHQCARESRGGYLKHAGSLPSNWESKSKVSISQRPVCALSPTPIRVEERNATSVTRHRVHSPTVAGPTPEVKNMARKVVAIRVPRFRTK